TKNSTAAAPPPSARRRPVARAPRPPATTAESKRSPKSKSDHRTRTPPRNCSRKPRPPPRRSPPSRASGRAGNRRRGGAPPRAHSIARAENCRAPTAPRFRIFPLRRPSSRPAGRGGAPFPGSARVPRAGFGVPPKPPKILGETPRTACETHALPGNFPRVTSPRTHQIDRVTRRTLRLDPPRPIPTLAPAQSAHRCHLRLAS
ncbi:MAG: hypothetical protein RLZZ15_4333, partial [Verrucomicrobiota bacterium]